MLTDSLLEPILISFAYLLGSVPTALLVCNSMGIADPRQQGSGNPGALTYSESAALLPRC